MHDFNFYSCSRHQIDMEHEVVISGMAGRFPQSDSVEEYSTNLYNKVDMVTEDDSRWEPGDIYFSLFTKQIIFTLFI